LCVDQTAFFLSNGKFNNQCRKNEKSTEKTGFFPDNEKIHRLHLPQYEKSAPQKEKSIKSCFSPEKI